MLAAPVSASATCAGDTSAAALNYSNGWADFGGSQVMAGYRRDFLGFVHLQGFIKNGTVGTLAFTLPVGYRPEGGVNHVGQNGGGSVAAAVSIASDGTAVVGSGLGNADVSLDGFSFYAGPDCSAGLTAGASGEVNLAAFTGDALATVNQMYALILAIGALVVLGVGYGIASRVSR
jgi:hypothetical protein